jgi:uncharacterized protein YdiU (UPF0061 family)
VGFVHGVMNTDNMTLSGETIDYGPCAFMEAYNPGTVFSSIDHGGRYAWGNQPGIARWNLARLAETLLPLLHEDADSAVAQASELINQFPAVYQTHWLAVMRAKLGLSVEADQVAGYAGSSGVDVSQANDETDLALIESWLAVLQGQGADWTLAHRHLCGVADATVPAADHDAATQRLAALFADPAGLNVWLPQWQARLQRNPGGNRPQVASAMRRTNPIYIARNQQVEQALNAASEDGNLAPFHALLAVVQHPFDEAPGQQRYAQPGHPDEVQGYHTFCGT